jgi:hypothetical protein
MGTEHGQISVTSRGRESRPGHPHVEAQHAEEATASWWLECGWKATSRPDTVGKDYTMPGNHALALLVVVKL